MGLHQWDEKRLLVPVILVLLATLLAFLPDFGQPALRFDRGAIAAGEWYRFLSGHLVHLGIAHAFMNIAGLVLVWYLVGHAMTVSGWLLTFLLAVLSIDAGIWFLVPDLGWYVGLSGVLHGLLAGGLVASWGERRLELQILAGLLVLKLAWEAVVGPTPGTGSMAGGNVITEAHLFGTIGGAIGGILHRIRVPSKPPI